MRPAYAHHIFWARPMRRSARYCRRHGHSMLRQCHVADIGACHLSSKFVLKCHWRTFSPYFDLRFPATALPRRADRHILTYAYMRRLCS